MNFRTWIRKTPAGRLFWGVFIGVVGGGITVFGAVLLVAPGPGAHAYAGDGTTGVDGHGAAQEV